MTEQEIKEIVVKAAVDAARQAASDTSRQVAESYRKEIHAIVIEAVKETLEHMGVDTSDPIQMQQDFAHLRQWRNMTLSMRSRSVMTILTLLITGVVSLILIAIREWLK